MTASATTRQTVEEICSVASDDIDNWNRRGWLINLPATPRGKSRRFSRQSVIEIALCAEGRLWPNRVDLFNRAAMWRAQHTWRKLLPLSVGKIILPELRKQSTWNYWWIIELRRDPSDSIKRVRLLEKRSDNLPASPRLDSSMADVVIPFNISQLVKRIDRRISELER